MTGGGVGLALVRLAADACVAVPKPTDVARMPMALRSTVRRLGLRPRCRVKSSKRLPSTSNIPSGTSARIAAYDRIRVAWFFNAIATEMILKTGAHQNGVAPYALAVTRSGGRRRNAALRLNDSTVLAGGGVDGEKAADFATIPPGWNTQRCWPEMASTA